MAKIALVEDDKDIRELMEYRLRMTGHEVWATETAEDALEPICEECVDLVLLDIDLPGMSGLELARQLRADERTANVGLIFVTASASEANVIDGFRAGADDYIAKPFSPRELQDRISAVLRGRGGC